MTDVVISTKDLEQGVESLTSELSGKIIKMTAEDETVHDSVDKPVENGFDTENKELDESYLEDDNLSLKLHLSDDEDETNPKKSDLPENDEDLLLENGVEEKETKVIETTKNVNGSKVETVKEVESTEKLNVPEVESTEKLNVPAVESTENVIVPEAETENVPEKEEEPTEKVEAESMEVGAPEEEILKNDDLLLNDDASSESVNDVIKNIDALLNDDEPIKDVPKEDAQEELVNGTKVIEEKMEEDRPKIEEVVTEEMEVSDEKKEESLVEVKENGVTEVEDKIEADADQMEVDLAHQISDKYDDSDMLKLDDEKSEPAEEASETTDEAVVEKPVAAEAIVETVEAVDETVDRVVETAETIVETVEAAKAIVETVEAAKAIVETVEAAEAIVETVEVAETGVETVESVAKNVEAIVEPVEAAEAITVTVEAAEAIAVSVEAAAAIAETVESAEATVETVESAETKDKTSEEVAGPADDCLIVVNMELTEEKNRELEEEDKQEDDESDEKESELDDESAPTAPTSTDITEDEELSQDTIELRPKIMSVKTLTDDNEDLGDGEDPYHNSDEDDDYVEEEEEPDDEDDEEEFMEDLEPPKKAKRTRRCKKVEEKRKLSDSAEDEAVEAKRRKIEDESVKEAVVDKATEVVDMEVETDSNFLSSAISMSIGEEADSEIASALAGIGAPSVVEPRLEENVIHATQSTETDTLTPLEEEPTLTELPVKKSKCEDTPPEKSDLLDISTPVKTDVKKKSEHKREKLQLHMLPKIFKDEKIPNIDIEEFILTKLIEAISQRTELAQLRFKAQKQETIIEQLRKKSTHLTKQLEDIATVTNRLSIDLQQKERPVAPVKITRSVGLQVCMPMPQAKRPYVPPPPPPQKKIKSKPPAPKVANNTTKATPASIKPTPAPTKAPAKPSPAKTTTAPTKTSPVKAATQVTKTPPTVLNKSLATRPVTNTLAQNKVALAESNKPVIDLTDEEDNGSKQAAPSLIPLNASNIRIVPSSAANNSQQNHVTYLMTAPGMGQNRQLLIATTGANVTGPRPTLVVSQNSRPQVQNQQTRYVIQNTNGQPVAQRQNVVLNGVRNVPVRMNSVIRPQNTQNRTVVPAAHPAPLPIMLNQPHLPNWRQIPPRPSLKIGRAKDGGIQLSWSMPELDYKIHEDVASYQLYAYQEGTAPPSSDLWRKVGDVKALPLPMACTLTSFHPGNKYYFAVRAIDVHSRVSQFSYAQPISLINN